MSKFLETYKRPYISHCLEKRNIFVLPFVLRCCVREKCAAYFSGHRRAQVSKQKKVNNFPGVVPLIRIILSPFVRFFCYRPNRCFIDN